MDVCYFASGELVVSLPNDVVEGKDARWLKGGIAAATGISRFRQRLFVEETLLGDDHTFTCVDGPLVVKLVILPFVPCDSIRFNHLVNAACFHYDMKVEEMLQLPLDPNDNDFADWTPLCAAAKAGAMKIVGLLLEAKADVDRPGRARKTPLMFAAMGGHDTVVQLLLESSASAGSGDAQQQTALHFAAGHKVNRSARVVTLLLDHRAVVNQSDKLLLDARAAANQADAYGVTPLVVAAVENNQIIGKMLLDANANVAAACRNGDTALHVATRHYDFFFVRLLVEHRASPCIKNDIGLDALQIAFNNSQVHLWQLLYNSLLP
eukprot:s3677_g4.t1